MELSKKVKVGMMAVGVSAFSLSIYGGFKAAIEADTIAKQFPIHQVNTLDKFLENSTFLDNFSKVREYRDSLKSVEGFVEARENYTNKTGNQANAGVGALFSLILALYGSTSIRKN